MERRPAKIYLNILISLIPWASWVSSSRTRWEALYRLWPNGGGHAADYATLLAFAYFAKPRQRDSISPWHAFVIGLAQACAVLPGLSRSGSTIATGLLLGEKKENLAQFSFLMVIPPILGEALLDFKDIIGHTADVAVSAVPTSSLIIAFVAAFAPVAWPAKWMINIVKKGKLIWFAAYCVIIGILLSPCCNKPLPRTASADEKPHGLLPRETSRIASSKKFAEKREQRNFLSPIKKLKKREFPPLI